MKSCPCCEKTLERLTDFPQVEILEVKRHELTGIEKSVRIEDNERYVDFDDKGNNEKVPEFVTKEVREHNKDEVFFEGWFYKTRGGSKSTKFYHRYRINEDQGKSVKKILSDYLTAVESSIGTTMKTAEVLPKLEKDKYFQWAYIMPGTIYMLGLNENEEKSNDDVKETRITIFGDGPNFGSAGGPTMEKVCIAATIKYRGKLNQ